MTLLPLSHPDELLWVLLVGWTASLTVLISQRRARIRLEAWLGPKPVWARRVALTDALLLVGLAATLIAVLGPRLGSRPIERAEGRDVVILIDTSRSMDAGDNPPSRLYRARQHAGTLLQLLDPGDRVALAAFAGQGLLLTPLTPDHMAVNDWLQRVDGELLRDRSSHIDAGIRSATEAFDTTRPERQRVLVLFSDGEPTIGPGRGVESSTLRTDVRLVAVALGSEEGSLVPDHGAVVVDGTGHPVLSRRRLALLRQWVQPSGGTVLAADRWGSIDRDDLARALIGPPGTILTAASPRAIATPLRWPFILVAVGCLLFEWLQVRAPGQRRARAGLVVAVGLCSLMALAGRSDPADARMLIERGLEAARAGRSEAARVQLEAALRASRNPEARAVARYDLGVLALEASRPQLARTHFLAALEAQPELRAAQFNLAWALRQIEQLAARKPPPQVTPPRTPAQADPRPAPAPLDAETLERWLESIEDETVRFQPVGPRGFGRSERSEPQW